MNEDNDWVLVRVSDFFKPKFNWHYIEPTRLSLWERILRWSGFVYVIRLNVKTSKVEVT